MPTLEKAVAQDVLEAVERAGGQGRLHEYSSGYGVGILQLPDVARFIRALAHVGVSARIRYSAGCGWKFDFANQPQAHVAQQAEQPPCKGQAARSSRAVGSETKQRKEPA